MIAFLAGFGALAILYALPGWIFLRRAGLDWPTRLVISVAATYGVVTALVNLLGAAGALSRWTVAAVLVASLAVAAVRPLPSGAVPPSPHSMAGPAAVGLGVGGILLAQAMRPGILLLPDAVSVWGPLAAEIGNNAEFAPEWLPTMTEAFPRSVGLIAGSSSLLLGGFENTHALMVHPIFGGLLVVAAALVAGRLGGRMAGWVVVGLMVTTPLIARGVFFHDDLVVAFMATTAVLLALRATTVSGWILAGVSAGGAMAVKHLGLVAVLLLGAVLVARRPAPSAWLGAFGGSVVGLPFYLWNWVRFGNPVHPLLGGVFGETEEVATVVENAEAVLLDLARGSPWEVGVPALVAVAAGLALWVARSAGRERDEVALVAALAVASVMFLAVWALSPYATRHVLVVYPVLAAIAAAGYARAESSADVRQPALRRYPAVTVAAAGLVALTAWNLVADAGDGPVEAETQSGIHALVVGKWSDLGMLFDPPEDSLTLFRPNVVETWRVLRQQDPEPLVFSFDTRSYHFPQHVLVANDVRALEIYAAGGADAQHSALVDAGVGYVLDRRGLSERYPIFAAGPWHDLAERPDLYAPLRVTRQIGLYAVLPP